MVQAAAENVRYTATAWTRLCAHLDLDNPTPVLVGQLWDLTLLVGERAAAREVRKKLQIAGHGVPDGSSTAADLAERISRTDADLARLAADIDQRRTHLQRLAEVAGFLTEQQALARTRATIREVDQRHGLPAPQADAAEDLADHTAAVLAAYRELTQDLAPAPAERRCQASLVRPVHRHVRGHRAGRGGPGPVPGAGRRRVHLPARVHRDRHGRGHRVGAAATRLRMAQRSAVHPAGDGWGPSERDMSNAGQATGDGRPLTIAGVVYEKGLGVHAVSRIREPLGGDCTVVRSDVGVDDKTGANGSVSFEVWVDGALRARTGVLTGGAGAERMSVDVTGGEELELRVTDGGDNLGPDHGDWAAARLACGTDLRGG